MAKLVITEGYVTLGGTEVSAYAKAITVNYSAEVQDTTTFGAATRTKLPGLKDWSMTIEFVQDYADNALDEILFALVGTSFTAVVGPASSAVGVNNPRYSGTAILDSYSPLAGSIGETVTASITLQGSGTLSRLTA